MPLRGHFQIFYTEKPYTYSIQRGRPLGTAFSIQRKSLWHFLQDFIKGQSFYEPYHTKTTPYRSPIRRISPCTFFILKVFHAEGTSKMSSRGHPLGTAFFYTEKIFAEALYRGQRFLQVCRAELTLHMPSIGDL